MLGRDTRWRTGASWMVFACILAIIAGPIPDARAGGESENVTRRSADSVETETNVAHSEVSRQTTGTAPRGRAHLWVDKSGGSCRRSRTRAPYRDRRACGSVAAAYNVANASRRRTVIMVKAGRYGRFQISGKRASRKRIVITAAPGARPVFSGDWMRVGITGRPDLAPKHVTIKRMTTGRVGRGHPDPSSRFGLLVDAGSRFIRFVNVSAGGFLFRGAKDIQLIGGDQGPCRRVGANGGSYGPCEINKVDHYPCSPQIRCVAERILIDRVDFHDFNFGPGCTGACHFRPMYLNGVRGFTMRNSTVRNSVFEPWTTISGPQAAARGNHNILIENNYFGANVQAGGGHGFSFAWCGNANAGVTAYKNVTFRFNSFARGMNLAVPASNSPATERGCLVENFRVYGNIFGARHASCGHAKVKWSFNVYGGRSGGRCGPGDRNTRRIAMRFYRRDVKNPKQRTAFRLVGRMQAPDNRVPVKRGCPRRDRVGVLRPKNSGFCDAGAHERRRRS